MEEIQKFIERYYPNYSRSSTIARLNDLAVLVEAKSGVDIDAGSAAEKILVDDYHDNLDSPHIDIDYNKLQTAVLEESIRNFYVTMKIVQLQRNYLRVTEELSSYLVEESNDIILGAIHAKYPFQDSFDDITYKVREWIRSTNSNLLIHES